MQGEINIAKQKMAPLRATTKRFLGAYLNNILSEAVKFTSLAGWEKNQKSQAQHQSAVALPRERTFKAHQTLCRKSQRLLYKNWHD
jgi:hypothetical protein